MGQTQKKIIFYSLLSFFGLIGVVLLAMLFVMIGAYALGADWVTDRDNEDRVVWASMALTLALWLPINLWCRRQIVCPVCRKSLFQTLWRVDWDFGEGRWTSNVRTARPHCAAQLP